MSVTNSAIYWAAPSPTTEFVTGRFWYDWVKPTVHLDGWGEFGRTTRVKVQRYNSLVLAVLLYGAETWPMTKSTTRKLEAAHHRWFRKFLHISWKDKVTNEKVRELAQQGLLEDIIRVRRLRCKVGGTSHEDGLKENCQTSYQLETDRWQKTSRPNSYRMAANSRS